MKSIDTSKLSHDECWGIQINGLKHCQNCKWTGISACEGKNIVKTGRNSNGYRIGDDGIVYDDYDPIYDTRVKTSTVATQPDLDDHYPNYDTRVKAS